MQLAAIAGVVGTLVVAAACGGPIQTVTAPTGCPSAETVALAQWNPKAVGSTVYRGTPKDAAWMVRLGYRRADDELAPPPGPIQGWQMAKLGLGPLPDQIWLLRPGLPACAGRVSGYVSERVDDGEVTHMISAVVTGCPAPAADDERQVAWVSFAGGEPKGCTLQTPVRVGSRVGIENPDDGSYTVPAVTAATALPVAWEVAAPEDPCEANCERLWAVDTVAGDPAVSQVLVTDMIAIEGNGAACGGYEPRDRLGFYATPKDGAPAAIGVGERLDLAGALVDERGTRVVLLTGADNWGAHDVHADGTLGIGRTVEYYIVHEESNLWQSLAPYCGP